MVTWELVTACLGVRSFSATLCFALLFLFFVHVWCVLPDLTDCPLVVLAFFLVSCALAVLAFASQATSCVTHGCVSHPTHGIGIEKNIPGRTRQCMYLCHLRLLCCCRTLLPPCLPACARVSQAVCVNTLRVFAEHVTTTRVNLHQDKPSATMPRTSESGAPCPLSGLARRMRDGGFAGTPPLIVPSKKQHAVCNSLRRVLHLIPLPRWGLTR